MKPEFSKAKPPLKPPSDKPGSSRMDLSFISSRYQQIQESNERLQKLISKFSNDPERRLNSVHESVICQAQGWKENREKSTAVKREVPLFRKKTDPPKLGVIEERPFKQPKKSVNDIGGKGAKGGKVKNFVHLNKVDAFDPHQLASKNIAGGKFEAKDSLTANVSPGRRESQPQK